MYTIIVVLIFIVFDIITGIVKALYQDGLNSTLLRKGLYHKLSEVLTIIGSWLVEYALIYINLNIDVPVLEGVAVYICIMELISILENLAEVNPSLAKLFKPYLEKLKSEDKE